MFGIWLSGLKEQYRTIRKCSIRLLKSRISWYGMGLGIEKNRGLIYYPAQIAVTPATD